ncbi:autotransporter outer membrane beta-barrel domain-containing protein [Castellaniella sp.]|uniref:autotransporter outer membrane beta-barrel domain-containing protein n=1 Tax=Castellaniella sp. TaxID=1955812 RepID=UPI002AFE3C79|nr:autotransporter outer membrane beta-barrel domain-containing protein [Castellaniella sp.]
MYALLDGAAGLGSTRYASALNDLSPGVLAAPAALKTRAMTSFADTLMRCPEQTGLGLRSDPQQCTWGRIIGNTSRVDGSGGNPGFKSDSVAYQIGWQRSLAPAWTLGVVGAYEHQSIRADQQRQHLKGDTGYLGAVTGSYGKFDNTRDVAVLGLQGSSSSRVASIGQRLRVDYTQALSNAYIKPFVNLDVVYTRMPSFSETGAGAADLYIESNQQWSAILTPGLEIGGRFELNSGYVVQPYASIGVALASTDQWNTRARFALAPSGTDMFDSELNTGRVSGQLSAGVQVSSKNGLDLRLQYDGQLSSQTRSHAGSLQASWRF